VIDTARALFCDDEARDGIVAVPSRWPTDFDRDAIERKVMTMEKGEVI